MSFDPTFLASSDLSDLTADERKVLADWETRLGTTYPQVGTIVDETK